MTALTEFFCDYCNASAQRRDEGVEDPHGYARELMGNYPLGWWEVPGRGPGGRSVGHACPRCVMSKPDVRKDIAQRRGEETARLIGALEPDHDEPDAERESDDPATNWPSRTSPFGG